MHAAAIEGHVQVARWLRAEGAGIHARNEEGSTPLLLACHAGSLELAQFLCGQGGRVEDADNEGDTPMHVAAMEGFLEWRSGCAHARKNCPFFLTATARGTTMANRRSSSRARPDARAQR